MFGKVEQLAAVKKWVGNGKEQFFKVGVKIEGEKGVIYLLDKGREYKVEAVNNLNKTPGNRGFLLIKKSCNILLKKLENSVRGAIIKTLKKLLSTKLTRQIPRNLRRKENETRGNSYLRVRRYIK